MEATIQQRCLAQNYRNSLVETEPYDSDFSKSIDSRQLTKNVAGHTDVALVQAPINVESPAAKIARLEHELRIAVERATVAEEQLRRVHIAVRAFKDKQLKARAAAAQAAATPAPEPSSGIYRSWAVNDPTLDERLTSYLESEFEPDRSRDWMLGS